jgi:hypothetical protein
MCTFVKIKALKMKKLLLISVAILTFSFASPVKAFQKKPTEKKEQSKAKKVQPKDYTVYITRTGEKFHSDGCQYLRRSQISIGKRNAISQGYSACSRCSP